MAYNLNDITFKLGQGGNGTIANGTDFISGLLFFNDARPALMGADNFSTGNVKQIFSLTDAEALGIVDTYPDETKSTATFEITNIGTDGETIEAVVTEWTGGNGQGTVSLGIYTKISADNTLVMVATGLVAAINAGTNTHGYIASNVGSTSAIVTITARAGMGIYLNSGTPYSKVIVTIGSGAHIAATIVQNVIVGVASQLAVYHYHIDRYFKVKPDGSLYIGIFDTSEAGDFNVIDNIVTYSEGSMVQLGIWDSTQPFDLTILTKIQSRIDGLSAQHKLLSAVVYAADIKALTSPLADLAGANYNLATLSNKNVSAIIDNDGNGLGLDLFYEHGKSITSLGACIGCISEAAISEDIGNPISRFNPDDGSEYDTLMFGDGTMFNTVSTSQLNALNNNRYIFLSKIPNTTGSYYSDDHTAIAYTNDYAWIHSNRVIDRVVKDSFVALVPVLKSRLKLNTDGTLTAQTIAHLISIEGEVIKPLIASDDLAGDADNFDASKWVLVSPTQKPNVTNKLVIGVKLAANGIAHSIEVPIGYGTI